MITVEPARVMRIVGELTVENELLREQVATLQKVVEQLQSAVRVDRDYRDGQPPLAASRN